MNKPKYQKESDHAFEDRVEKCIMCDGYGYISDDSDLCCDWCDGCGRVTEDQLREYLTPPAFEDWKYRLELKAIDAH